MKKLNIAFLSIFMCVCLLCTLLPLHSFASSTNGSKDTTTEDSNTDDSNKVQSEPITLKGSMHNKRSVSLKWNSDDEDAVYKVYRSTSKTSGFKLIKTKSDQSGTSSLIDPNLTVGETYYYKVKKVKDDTVLVTSNTASVKIRLKPVENLETTITSKNTVKLTWDKASYATSYIIYRSFSKNGEYERIGNPKANTFTDTNVYSARRYYYKIYSWKKDVSSAKSEATDPVVAYTKTLKPSVSLKYASKKVTVSWDEVRRATKYYVYRSTKDGNYKKIGETTKLKYTDDSVSSQKRYYYKVRGVYKKDGNTILGYYSNSKNIFTNYIDPDKKMVALTFDDGPGPYTKEIVDCLRENNARATFFVLGSRIDTYKDALAYTYKYGNEIANHSYSHPNLTGLSSSGIKSELKKTDDKVEAITGEKPVLLRTPGGATNSTVKSVCGKPIIFWSIDTLDWKHRNASKTVSSVMNNVKDGDIVLMHDIHSPTKDAALQLIPKLKKAGYQLVTVSELAKYKGYNLKNGTVYSSLR